MADEYPGEDVSFLVNTSRPQLFSRHERNGLVFWLWGAVLGLVLICSTQGFILIREYRAKFWTYEAGFKTDLGSLVILLLLFAAWTDLGAGLMNFS